MTDERMALLELIEKGADADRARDAVLRRRQADGGGGASPHRGGARFARTRAPGAAQRLSRTRLGYTRGADRAGDPQAAPRQLLPHFPRAKAHRRECADRSDRRGLCARRLDALGGRPGQGDGSLRRLQESGQPPRRRDRWAGECLPHPADRGRMAYLWIDAT